MRAAASKSPLNVAELLSAVPPRSRVIDLGCGGGTPFLYSNSDLKILALDEAVDEKIKSFPAHVQFARAVASAIPARDGVADLVVANFAFEHFPDAAAALREIERVLKDAGRAWISMPNAGSFEDQLYRNLYAGGGHLQHPSVEWFLRHVYSETSLKLISWLELPAGFTYLGQSEELQHLTWAVVDALRRTVGLDARSRSGYAFVLEKFAAAGPGYVEHLRCCSSCGTPDGTTSDGANDPGAGEPWTCAACGARNAYPSAIPIARLDDISRAIRLEWERHPETRPQRLRELVDERSRWGQEVERQLAEERTRLARLQAEFDERSRWGQEMERQLAEERTRLARLQAAFDERGRWALSLDADLVRERERWKTEIDRLEREVARLTRELERIPPRVRRWVERIRAWMA
jgi:SAM-dependent methyltransferase